MTRRARRNPPPPAPPPPGEGRASRKEARHWELPTCAVYVRTSAADQDGKAQLHALRRAAAARGWKRHAVYTDLDHSGASSSAGHALKTLLGEVRAGKIRQVMVSELSRLGRTTVQLLLLLDELLVAGAALISLKESLDLTTAAGRMFVQQLAVLAEFERARMRERQLEGIARAQENGTRFGRPRRGDVSGQQVMALRDDGWSWRKIAMSMHAPVSTCRSAAARVERLRLDAVRKPTPLERAIAERAKGGDAKR
jgi:putative DNA-invertase from lambdoid prophage Rac